ncbi:MAG: TraR/DksA C4-type zinc finger protein [Kordiimonadaceae bacterium]|nr:TraR/DksA C4-type zinc finger protein [Kordiimonadaceae bacterium]
MDTKAWHSRLIALKAELQALDKGTADARKTVELDQSKVGRLSRMDALQGQAMSNAVAARRQQALLRIDAAIERLKDGEFGYCIGCGDKVAAKRLQLDPAVATCTACAH